MAPGKRKPKVFVFDDDDRTRTKGNEMKCAHGKFYTMPCQDCELDAQDLVQDFDESVSASVQEKRDE